VQEAINFVNQIISTGQQWTDPDFEPNQSSIAKSGPGTENKPSRNYKWKRASEIYPKL
jgi:hypothetical protein